MTGVVSDDVVRIDFNIFQTHFTSVGITNNDKLHAKKVELLKNKCFTGETQEKKYVKYEKDKRTTKLQIISSNCTEEVKFQKNFKGMMNKLSTVNKDLLLPRIKSFIKNTSDVNNQEIMFRILWGFIKQSYTPIYIDVIDCFEQELIEHNISDFVKNKEWYPCEVIVENNILSSSKSENNDEKYDMYCKYVKWKKETINSFYCIKNILMRYKNDCLIEQLLQDVFFIFQQNKDIREKTHLLDFSLEVVQILNSKDKTVCTYLEGIEKEKLNSSTKFLILDILSGK